MERNKLAEPLFALVGLVDRLRGPDGCPWDARQTDDSIKMYLLEEAYEVLDAIEGRSPKEVCQELGDLLFQILFLARLAEEREEFDLGDVIEGITKKMINRHPHVFKGVKVDGPEEVAQNWDRIKKQEKGGDISLSSELQDVPVHLPALLRAHRLQEKASRGNEIPMNADKSRDRVEKDIDGLRETLAVQDDERIGEAIGDLIFSLVHLARHWGYNGEHLLRGSNKKFIENFKKG